jgi:hypothetical protein
MGNSEIVTTGRRPQPRSEKLPIRACSSAAPTAISHGDRPSSRVVEFIGALLVLAETGILFAGVVSRYVFNSPIMNECAHCGRRG